MSRFNVCFQFSNFFYKPAFLATFYLGVSHLMLQSLVNMFQLLPTTLCSVFVYCGAPVITWETRHL